MDQLPVGFRFYPTEEELISFYLHYKLHSQIPELDRVIPSIDIYNFEPFQLPELAGQLCQGEKEQWFFFMPQQEREARGGRPTRTTVSGYWKATGSPSFVYSSQNKVIGVKKIMVFYKGKAPNGRKTKWKMNEYKAIKQEDNSLNNSTVSPASIIPQLRNEVSLCRVYVTSGCARAFDRRPQGVVFSDNTNATNEDVTTRNWNMNVGQGIGTSASQGINTTATLMESSGSTDSSNSGGDRDHLTIPNAAITGGNNSINDIDMVEDFGPLNWEDLGWI